MSNLISPASFSATGALQTIVANTLHHFSGGKRFDTNNAVVINTGTPSPIIWQNGLPFNSSGELYVVDVAAASGTKQHMNGLCFDSTGAVICVEESVATAPLTYANGLKFDANGALIVTSMAFELDFTTGVMDSRLTYTSRGSNATQFDSQGRLVFAAANMLLNTATLGTQSVTVVNGGKYTVSFYGTGSITFSGGGSGTLNGIDANTRVSTTITTTSTSVTCTVSGTVTSAQFEPYGIDSPKPYAATTGSAYYAPRLDYDPGSLQMKGLLLEEGATNLFTWSTNLDNATGGWTITDTTVSTASVLGPDGFPCQLLTEGTLGTAVHAKTVTITTGNFVAFSVYAKMASTSFPWMHMVCYDGTNGFQAYFNLQLGIAGAVSLVGVGGTATAAYIENIGNGWFRCIIIGKLPAGTSATAQTYSAASDGGARVNSATRYVFGPQIECVASAATRWASSYIPTYSAAGGTTRSADNTPYLTVGSWFNSAGSTVVCEASVPPIPAGTQCALWGFNNGAATNRIFGQFNTGGLGCQVGVRWVSGNVDQYNNTTGVAIPGWSNRSATAWAASDLAYYDSSGNNASQASGTLPVGVTTLNLGASTGTATVTGARWIKSFKYYARRRANAELAVLAMA